MLPSPPFSAGPVIDPARDPMLVRILVEAEESGRRGWEFVPWWLSKVCRNAARAGFIDQLVHDQALAAWQRGRLAAGQSGLPREATQDGPHGVPGAAVPGMAPRQPKARGAREEAPT